jgi:hypothetical protein
MSCAECKLLADQTAMVLEEIQKMKEQFAEAFQAGRAADDLLRTLAASERAYERCLAAMERHALSHQSGSRSFVSLHAW